MAAPELKIGLFARTFLLLAMLMLASLAAWVHVFWTLEREPQIEQIANQVVRATELTQTARQHILADSQAMLYEDINSNSDFIVVQGDEPQAFSPLPNELQWQSVAALVEQRLGPETVLGLSNSATDQIWVQLDDQQWLGVPVKPIGLASGPEWVSWIAAAALLSMVGAAVAVGYLNRPLARLARVAQQLSRGQTPDRLPESGAQEIQQLNSSFNRMVTELQQAEADRNLMLAGISHDLRTPLARMRLEIEMSPMSPEQRQAIDADLSQIDRTIGQLLQYARPGNDPPDKAINLRDLVADVVRQTQPPANTSEPITLVPGKPAMCRIDAEDFRRCLTNLIENARRYGAKDTGHCPITVTVKPHGERIYIDVSDQGPGIATHDIERVLRPFSRGETARTGSAGAGLGLSIVQRLLARVDGYLSLMPAKPHGLTARMDLPRARRTRHRASGTKTQLAQ